MRQLLRKGIRFWIKKTAGKMRYQRIYHVLLDIALRGMNYRNTHFRTSGEIEVIKLIADKKEINPEVTIFDVGANVGGYTQELVKYFSGNTKIYSFEPSKNTFGRLMENIKNSSPVMSYNFGFSNVEKELSLYKDESAPGMASVYHRDLSKIGLDTDSYELIKVTTIDKFCSKHGIDHIDFLKIDVEGHEFDVLQGAQRMINEQRIDYVQLEFGEANIDSRHFLRDFYQILPDFTFYRVVKDGISPLGEYNEVNEIFRTINLVAERNIPRITE